MQSPWEHRAIMPPSHPGCPLTAGASCEAQDISQNASTRLRAASANVIRPAGLALYQGNKEKTMKITDIQTFQYAGPELAETMYPAWAPGSEWKRWGGTVVKVFTDEG